MLINLKNLVDDNTTPLKSTYCINKSTFLKVNFDDVNDNQESFLEAEDEEDPIISAKNRDVTKILDFDQVGENNLI